ncbi:hypothetical protein QBC43DRAFT_339619 [Cladorrhinum sp. PSN259]|nr:hypothetical protein QBC43DRAFT_339619 [Cladorrhinum sp. PSN259]
MVLLGFTSLIAADEVNQTIPNGYRAIQTYWEVRISVDGPTAPQWGTVEQAFANMSANYPGWSDAFPIRNFTDSPEAQNISSQVSLYERESYFCGRPWHYCWRYAIVESINYLYTVPGKPKNGPGPGECSGVSCKRRSAIWWCNDNKEQFELQSYVDLADAAFWIYHYCRDETLNVTAGQIFYKEHWNTIVTWNNDC